MHRGDEWCTTRTRQLNILLIYHFKWNNCRLVVLSLEKGLFCFFISNTPMVVPTQRRRFNYIQEQHQIQFVFLDLTKGVGLLFTILSAQMSKFLNLIAKYFECTLCEMIQLLILRYWEIIQAFSSICCPLVQKNRQHIESSCWREDVCSFWLLLFLCHWSLLSPMGSQQRHKQRKQQHNNRFKNNTSSWVI